MNCLIDTPGGEVNGLMTRLDPGHEPPQFKLGTNGPWNWGLLVPKTIKMMPGRPLMTNLKMTVQDDCAVSACSTPSHLHSVYKSAPHPLLVQSGGGGGQGSWWGESAFGQMSATLPPLPPVASIWTNRLSFPLTWHAYQLLSCEQPDPHTPFGNNQSTYL